MVHMALRETRTFASGIVLLSYETARETPTTRYVDSFAWTKEQIDAGSRPRATRPGEPPETSL